MVACSVCACPTRRRPRRWSRGHVPHTRHCAGPSSLSAGYRPRPTRARASQPTSRRRPTPPPAAPATSDCGRPACSAPRRAPTTTVDWATWRPCRRWVPATARSAAATRRRSPWRPSRAPACCSWVVSRCRRSIKTSWCRQPASSGCEKLENLSSPVDMQTHAGSAFGDNRVILTFDPRVTVCQQYTACPPSWVLIAQAVFLLERGHTYRKTQTQTPLTTLPTHRLPTAGVSGFSRIYFHKPIDRLNGT